MEVEAEIILPEQFLGGTRSDCAISGEKALHLAVLTDGIRCFNSALRNRRQDRARLAAQAEAWIEAIDERSLFSFVNVCETLGIDPDALREALLGRRARSRRTSG